MAKYNITAPDSTKYQVTALDDATQDQVLAYSAGWILLVSRAVHHTSAIAQLF